MMQNRTKGIACIVASAFGFALMAFFVRLCDDFGGQMSAFQKSFFRNVVALSIALPIFFRDCKRHPVADAPASASHRRNVILGILARSVFGTIGIFCNFYALSRMHIGDAMTLNKTAPFFTVLFSWLLLGERVSARQFGFLFVAFAGAMLVMRPGFGGGDSAIPFFALAGGLCAGLAYVCVHELGRFKVRTSLIVMCFSAFSCIASIPFTLMDFRPMTLAQIFILLGAGAGAAIGQFGVTAAYRFAEPRQISVFDYTNVIFTSLLGWCFFAQIPDVLSVIGFVAIVCAGWFMRRK